MIVEFMLVSDDEEEYSDVFLTLSLPMPPRVGEWFTEIETTDLVDDFEVVDVSYVVDKHGSANSVVFCKSRLQTMKKE